MPEFEKLIDASKRGALEDVKTILHDRPEVVKMRDELGATPLHHAAFGGHRAVAQFLVQQGADINAPDSQFGATPAGWAIEYLREMGGLLGIELTDFAYAIRRGDVEWTKRFLTHFPGLRRASDTQENSFKLLAEESGNAEIVAMFEADADLVWIAVAESPAHKSRIGRPDPRFGRFTGIRLQPRFGFPGVW